MIFTQVKGVNSDAIATVKFVLTGNTKENKKNEKNIKFHPLAFHNRSIHGLLSH